MERIFQTPFPKRHLLNGQRQYITDKMSKSLSNRAARTLKDRRCGVSGDFLFLAVRGGIHLYVYFPQILCGKSQRAAPQKIRILDHQHLLAVAVFLDIGGLGMDVLLTNSVGWTSVRKFLRSHQGMFVSFVSFTGMILAALAATSTFSALTDLLHLKRYTD